MTVSPNSVRFDQDTMWVELTDRRTLRIPLASFPRLRDAPPSEREKVELRRLGLHWEALDEDISIEGLLAGQGATLVPHAGAEANARALPLANVDDLVLGTTNASYSRSLSAAELIACLASGESGTWTVHVATFFTEVRPELILRVAEVHSISRNALATAYHKMKARTGEANPALENALEHLAPAP
jgi:hypothetical protein